MLKDVIRNLRKINNLTQEEVALKLNVSRQSVAKWENGLSIPDIYNTQELCKLFHVSINELLESDVKNLNFVPPINRFFFGYVRIDEEGRIKLPEECFEMMNLKKGDALICLGDLNEGLALAYPSHMEKLAKSILQSRKEFENDNRD